MTEVCGVKETQCTHCNHLQVCSFKAQFLAAQKAIDEVTVGTGDSACQPGVLLFLGKGADHEK